MIERIDLLSIDIEGGELEILKDIEYDRFPIHVIVAENNFGDKKNEEFLRTKGFRKAHTAGVDEIYINERFVPNPEENAGNK